MLDRLTRRMEALQKQIDADKAKQGQATNGLTVPTQVEKYHAQSAERRQIADFQDTAPGGIPC